MILEHDPAHREALYHSALVLFNLGEYEAAAETFGMLLEAAPEDPESLNYLGLCLLELDKPQRSPESL